MTHFSLRESSPLQHDDSYAETHWHDAAPLARDGDAGDPGEAWELRPDERIGRPLRRARWRRLLRSAVVSALVVGAGWSWLTDGPLWSGLSWATGELVEVARHAMADAARPTAEASARPAPTVTSPEPAAAVSGIVVAEATPASQPEPAAAQRIAAEPAAAEPDAATAPDVGASQPYAPPAEAAPTPLAPYQKRAVAAGLHPDLSRAVLDTLSDADWRNAADAVRKALAATAQAAVVSWPRQPARGHAAFTVHFVPGAAEGCRRFVVVIAKAGWETTAQPMESCGGRFVPVRG